MVMVLMCRMMQLLVAECKRAQMMSQTTVTKLQRRLRTSFNGESDDVEEQNTDELLEELREEPGTINSPIRS